MTGNAVCSQTPAIIEGVVVSKPDNIPLNHATVAIKGKSVGTTTNSDGFFSISLHEVDPYDTLYVSYLGHEPYKLSVRAFIETGEKAIELEETGFAFSEVTVKPSDFNLNEFMEEVIREYNRKRRRNHHIALSHYREKATFEGTYMMFNESVGYSVYMGETQSFGYGAYLKERDRFHPVTNYGFIYENTRISDVGYEWEQHGDNYLNWRLSDQNRQPLGGNIPLIAFRFFEIRGPLGSDVEKDIGGLSGFRYRLDSTYYLNNQLVYRIHFSPGILNLKKKERGTMDVFADNYRILRVDCYSSDLFSGLKSFLFEEDVDGEISFEFQYFDERPYLSSALFNYGNNGCFHEIKISVLVQKFDEFEFELKEYQSIGAYANNPFIVYETKKWQSYRIPEDKDVEKIKDDLGSIGGKDIYKQFHDNSGDWYVAPEANELPLLEKAQSVINNLKSFF